MPNRPATSLTRRGLLRASAGALGGFALTGPLQALLANRARASFDGSPIASPYGEPRPTLDQTTGLPLLKLPPYFKYASFGWTGDLMRDGLPTPSRHDGMGVVRSRGDALVLIRNHEGQPGAQLNAPPGAGFVYDDAALGPLRFEGGTTTLVWDRVRGWRRSQASLGGTLANCSGGITPWGTWISCEEFVLAGAGFGGKDHGFAFEVSPFGNSTAEPIRDMGIMRHEAAAVDPVTGIVYETEDNGDLSGFYRYLPNRNKMRRGQLEKGGTLQMLGVVGDPTADLRAPELGDEYDVVWAAVPEPATLPSGTASAPYTQGRNNGGAQFDRLEGCFFDPFEGACYFADTRGGAARVGAVWRYTPPANEVTGTGRLTAVFVGGGSSAIDRADNLVVSPRGGLLICEDGTNTAGTNTGLRMMGVTSDGCSYEFAVNNIELDAPPPGRPQIRAGDYRGQEWAGACFDPVGSTLFANIQTPGVTFAITGPFGLGPL